MLTYKQILAYPRKLNQYLTKQIIEKALVFCFVLVVVRIFFQTHVNAFIFSEAVGCMGCTALALSAYNEHPTRL